MAYKCLANNLDTMVNMRGSKQSIFFVAIHYSWGVFMVIIGTCFFAYDILRDTLAFALEDVGKTHQTVKLVENIELKNIGMLRPRIHDIFIYKLCGFILLNELIKVCFTVKTYNISFQKKQWTYQDTNLSKDHLILEMVPQNREMDPRVLLTRSNEVHIRVGGTLELIYFQ